MLNRERAWRPSFAPGARCVQGSGFYYLAEAAMTRCTANPPAVAGSVPANRPSPPSYELCGPPDGRVVVVLGGISASRHVRATDRDPTPGWWQALVGPGLGVDTEEFRVLSFDWVTAPEGSVTTADQAEALAQILDHLAIRRVAAIVGASYGGMVALCFGSLFPDRVERLVVLSAAHRPHPMATAQRVLQRRIVQLGQLAGIPASGVALARGLGITTYRSASEFAGRFAVEPSWHEAIPRFPVEDYLEHGGKTFARRFDAKRYLALSESLDLHRVDPATINTPTTLFGVAEDQLVPLWQLVELRDAHGGECDLRESSSRYGHDAFLKEVDIVSSVVSEALAREVPHAELH